MIVPQAILIKYGIAAAFRKAAEMKVWYAAAIKSYDKANNKIIKDARDEAAKLREKLAKLSVADACHQAWVELTK